MLSPQQMLTGGGPQQPQEAPVAGPNQPQPLFELGPFKGLDLWRSPLQMQDQYLTDMSMMVLDEVLGAITNSAGRIAVHTGYTSPNLGMDVFRPANPSGNTVPYLFLVDGNGNWQQVDYVNGSLFPQVTFPAGATWNNTAQTFMATLNHVMLFCDGISTPLKMRDDWNTAAPVAQFAGVIGPTSPLSAADNGVAGNLNGAYRWRYTFQNGQPFGGESTPSAASDQPGPLTLANHGAQLTNIQVSSDPQVTLVNIYRLGGSIPEWRFVAAIPNGSTSYNDNIGDLSLGQLLVLDRSLPPAGLTQIVTHKNRVFGFIGNTLQFTLYNEPESWPILFQLPVGDNSPIVAIGSASGSALFIWKQRETWVLGGDSIANFNLQRLWGIGIMGPRAWCASDDVVTWMSNDGIHAARVSASTQTQSRWLVGTPVWSFVKNLPTNVKNTASLASDGSRVMISFPNATPSVIFSLNTRVGDWEREKNPLWLIYGLPKFGEWEKFPFQGFSLVPLFTGSDPGYFAFAEPVGGGFEVHAWPSNAANPYLDLGNPVSWLLERKQVEHGSGMTVKRYSEVEIVAPVQTTGQTLTLTFTVDDNINKVYTFTFGLDNGPARLGLPPQIEGNYCTVRISGSHSQKIQIDRIRVWGWIDHRYKTTSQYGVS